MQRAAAARGTDGAGAPECSSRRAQGICSLSLVQVMGSEVRASRYPIKRRSHMRCITLDPRVNASVRWRQHWTGPR